MMRVATVGIGSFADHHLEAWNRISGVELAAVCGHSSLERTRAFAERWRAPEAFVDPAAMLDQVKPDLLDIISTPESHAGLVRLAAERGVAVICQKPLAMDLTEAIGVVQSAEAASIPLIVHENWRFKPWCREIARLIASGVIGKPDSVAFQMRFGYPAPGHGHGPDAYSDRPYLRTRSRFLMQEVGIHMIDVFRFLFGEVDSVVADLRRLNPIMAGEDAFYMIFRFVDGSGGFLDGNRVADLDAQDRSFASGLMMIDGADGYIHMDGDGGLWVKRRGEPEARHHYARPTTGYAGDCVYAQQMHAVDSLRAGCQAENTGREYLRNMLVEEAFYRSGAERRWVDIQDMAAEFALS